jgi:MHS family proline/betaine transporter-like MFS transporter
MGVFAYFLANGVVMLHSAVLSREQMMVWGWRLPFILVVVPGVVAAWGRRRMPESELFLESLKSRTESNFVGFSFESPAITPQGTCGDHPTRRREGMRHLNADAAGNILYKHSSAMVICIGALSCPSVTGYVGLTWTASYLQQRGMPAVSSLGVTLISRFLHLLLLPYAGRLIDIHGIGWLTLRSSAATVLVGLPVFVMLDIRPTDFTVVLLTLGFGLGSATSFHHPFLFCAELFPTPVRSFCLGISWNLALCIWGGGSIVCAQASLRMSAYGPGFMISASGLVSIVSVLWAKREERLGRLCLAHRRASPYWEAGSPRPTEHRTWSHVKAAPVASIDAYPSQVRTPTLLTTGAVVGKVSSP